VQKDPKERRNRPEPQRLARDAADPERASFGALRVAHGRDPAKWPAKDRKRFEAWQRRQLERKAAERAAWREQRAGEIDQALAALAADDSPAAEARATGLRAELERLRAEVTRG
jgi:hypothetical protein